MSKNFELLEQLKNGSWKTASVYSREPKPPAQALPEPNLETRAHAELGKLVQRLFLSGTASVSRRVAFTGTGPGVGCTCVTIHSAEVLASHDAGSVCLLEATKNSSGIRAHYNLGDSPGLGDVLTGNELANDLPLHSFARQVRNNLWVVPGDGNQSDYPVSFRPRLQSYLLELQSQFDYVLIDTHPLIVGSNQWNLAVLTDGAVLVLKAGHTRRTVARLAIAELEAAGVKVLGTVLNQRDYPIPEVIYKRI
jgi:Mrp family chromosome partitioning ATPase